VTKLKSNLPERLTLYKYAKMEVEERKQAFYKALSGDNEIDKKW
jgi:hypothetical protein